MKALDVARAELAQGIREASGHNDGTPAARYMDGLEAPWCAGFVRWCFEQARSPLPGARPMLVSVRYLEEQLTRAGARLDHPEPGAIVTFKWRVGSDPGTGRHVGIVERVEGGRVHTIEGNSGDKVAARSYPLGAPELTAFFRWPREAA
jgi:hypothetical protein